MQLVQFVLIIVHSIYSMMKPQCEWPKIFVYLTLLNAALFFYLFFSFYRATYHSKTTNPEKPDDKHVNKHFDKPDDKPDDKHVG